MISQLHIENFRSIEKATIDLGRITLLTGSNNSGKSSVLYALQCLQGIRQNPNRTLDALFNLPSINLGGFDNVVHKKDITRDIKLKITLKDQDKYEVDYILELSKKISRVGYSIKYPLQFGGIVALSFPYISFDIGSHSTKILNTDIELNIKYDGISLFYEPANSYPIPTELKNNIDKQFQQFNSFAYIIEFVPMSRGFLKPYFGRVPLQEQINSADEVATQISLDFDLQGYISHYLEKIADRRFNVRVIPNTAVFYMQTTDVKTGFTTDLVNEGTGTNQLVTMLAKALQPDKKFICIDEPEIHLHPSMIAKLVEALVEIAYTQDKQFMLSTHSEHFVTCLLAEVVKKNLQPDDLKVYYLTKDDQQTNIEHQTVNADGQIEGGLKNFYEAELSNLETFFKIA
jgi:predicted ATPase